MSNPPIEMMSVFKQKRDKNNVLILLIVQFIFPRESKRERERERERKKQNLVLVSVVFRWLSLFLYVRKFC
jgi:hypothetical protein